MILNFLNISNSISGEFLNDVFFICNQLFIAYFVVKHDFASRDKSKFYLLDPMMVLRQNLIFNKVETF
jgi:hypothetical protein